MGEADRYSEYPRPPRRKFSLGQDGNALMTLFSINVVVFLLFLFLQAIYAFTQSSFIGFDQDVVPYFQMPARFTSLLHKPWTFFTYMFTNLSVWTMIGNMLWLWAFGSILQDLSGNGKLIPIYLYGGIMGAFAFIAANYLIPALKEGIPTAVISGGNASNMAIAMAATTLAPDYRFFRNLGGGIPIWILMLVYILIDLASIASYGAPFGLAHLAGAGAGFLFIYFLRKDIDLGAWMTQLYYMTNNAFKPNKNKQSSPIREKVFYKTAGRSPYKKTANITQQRVDEILDKINQKGYHFLTEEEKTILKRAAEDEDL